MKNTTKTVLAIFELLIYVRRSTILNTREPFGNFMLSLSTNHTLNSTQGKCTLNEPLKETTGMTFLNSWAQVLSRGPQRHDAS